MVLRLSGLAGVVSALVAVGPGAIGVQAQGATRPARAAAPAALRTVDGQPDLQGIWRFATLTPLERPKELAGKEALSAEEAAKLEAQAERTRHVEAPPRPGDPGGYNRFWVESGTTVIGTRRTSLVIDPPDGRVPPLTPEGQKREDLRAEIRHRAEGPESMPVYDRCILGFNSGPPIIPVGYNQNLQIFQTRDHVVIHTEMVHDARIVPLDGRPRLPTHLRQWAGDSRARWEGQTLLIETTNFTDKGTGTLALDPEFFRRGLGAAGDENLHLVERFTRVAPDTLQYEFTINNPAIWTRPWTVAMTMTRTQEPLYEYACHEGNYGMAGILGGARAQEKAGTAAAGASSPR